MFIQFFFYTSPPQQVCLPNMINCGKKGTLDRKLYKFWQFDSEESCNKQQHEYEFVLFPLYATENWWLFLNLKKKKIIANITFNIINESHQTQISENTIQCLFNVECSIFFDCLIN